MKSIKVSDEVYEELHRHQLPRQSLTGVIQCLIESRRRLTAAVDLLEGWSSETKAHVRGELIIPQGIRYEG